MSDNKIQWLIDTVRETNNNILTLSKITAGHAMALKILGAALVLVAGALTSGVVAIALEVFKK